MDTIDAVIVDAANDDPAPTPGSPAPGHAHDGARRLRRCSAFSSREEAARLLLVAGPTAARAESEVRYGTVVPARGERARAGLLTLATAGRAPSRFHRQNPARSSATESRARACRVGPPRASACRA